MRIGLGVLHWPPAAFWSATPHELQAAIEAKTRARRDPKAMTRSEYEALKEKLGLAE